MLGVVIHLHSQCLELYLDFLMYLKLREIYCFDLIKYHAMNMYRLVNN
jgi:hypothetical protein